MNSLIKFLIFLFFITACTQAPIQTFGSRDSQRGKISVLCQCKEGFTSWEGQDEFSATKRAKENCASIGGVAGNCQVVE